jgi:hypothetical protein
MLVAGPRLAVRLIPRLVLLRDRHHTGTVVALWALVRYIYPRGQNLASTPTHSCQRGASLPRLTCASQWPLVGRGTRSVLLHQTASDRLTPLRRDWPPTMGQVKLSPVRAAAGCARRHRVIDPD